MAIVNLTKVIKYVACYISYKFAVTILSTTIPRKPQELPNSTGRLGIVGKVETEKETSFGIHLREFPNYRGPPSEVYDYVPNTSRNAT